MRSGWRCRAGPPPRWPLRWGATRTRWRVGWPPFAGTGPPRWPSPTPAAPPALNPAQQALLKAAVQQPPREAGIDLADWNWKVVRRYVAERFGITLQRSSCRNYLHRLGFVLKRPKKRLLKANEAKRTAFVASYASLRAGAQTAGAKHFFVDEAHFYADVDLRGKWVL
jgi:transposase